MYCGLPLVYRQGGSIYRLDSEYDFRVNFPITFNTVLYVQAGQVTNNSGIKTERYNCVVNTLTKKGFVGHNWEFDGRAMWIAIGK